MKVDKIEIQELGLNAVKEFFKVDPAKFDKDFLKSSSREGKDWYAI